MVAFCFGNHIYSLDNMSDILSNILNGIKGAEVDEVEKTAEAEGVETTEVSEGNDDVVKLAEDAVALGKLIGGAAADTYLAKLAAAVPAGGGGIEPRSQAEAIADKISKMKGKDTTPGDDTSKRAREEGALHGADGEVNPANYRG